MMKYIILFIVVTIVIILFMTSDLLKSNDPSDKDLFKLQKILKNKKNSDYLSDNSESVDNTDIIDDSSDLPFSYDETEISFDNSESISKTMKILKKNNGSNNKKLLDDFKKFIEIKNKNTLNKKDNQKANMNRKNTNIYNIDMNKHQTNKNKINIQEMHKLAAKLSKKEPQKISEKITDINNSDININNDLTDTINGIIHNELNRN